MLTKLFLLSIYMGLKCYSVYACECACELLTGCPGSPDSPRGPGNPCDP